MSTPETVVTGELPESSGALPVETPAPAESPPAAVNPSETTEAKEKSGFEKRISELTKARRHAEREAERWYEEAMALKRRAEAPPPPPASEPKLPTMADYGWDEKKYAEALIRAAVPKPESIRDAYRAMQEQEDKAVLYETFREREAEFAKQHEDYEEVAHYSPISAAVADMLREAEEGPELAYYLGKNHDVAKSLSKLPAGAAGVELGKIAARLAVEKAKAAEKALSKAPPPTPKVEGVSESAASVRIDSPESDSLSDAEWTRRRKAQLLRRKG